MDGDYSRNELDADQPCFEHALFVKSQVMSVSEGHAVCDAGHKSHAIDCGMPLVCSSAGSRSEIEYFNGGDEHGVLRLAISDKQLPLLGETVWLIPGHCDPTVNLYDHLIGIRGGLQHGTVERIVRVDARGALT
jgi:D-serine deaminase-like pyridoxal phosphate-dependent protein